MSPLLSVRADVSSITCACSRPAARTSSASPRDLEARGRARARAGIELLTEPELQVARLVVDRKTNAQIAAELFLSQKTVETHLRNIFNKMGVETRVALARAVERADRAGSARPG
jgi:DNA-binding NarL/FixJ family response regulator